MTREYEVYTSGFPEESRKIRASTPEEAALIHFKENLYRNGIIVRVHLWNEKLFLWSDLAKHFPEIKKENFKYRKPKEELGKKLPWWKDLFYRFIFGNDYYR